MYNVGISIIKRVNMAKTAKKSAKKAVKKVKKVNPGFERAVKTAMWGTVGFAILTMF